MKNISLLILLTFCTFFTSCEDVIDLDLDTAAPKLVVEAEINWQKGTSGENQYIKLTTTTGYYDQTTPIISGATVFITNSTNFRFDFNEIPGSGRYICDNFIPVLNETYTLTVINNGQTYTATETMTPITPITRIEQNDEGGLLGDEIEVKTFFDDPDGMDNFYLYHYIYSNKVLSTYYTQEDTFFQGNEMSSSSQNHDLKAGDEIEITHLGISKQYYNYMSILIEIADGGGGGPFQAPPAIARGNVINQTNFDDYALGYFSLSETDSRSYTIQ